MEDFRVLGIMSGSSLDGVDLALCSFIEAKQKWSYEIIATDCVPFKKETVKTLRELPNATAKEFCQAHFDFGHLLGEMANQFLLSNNLKADLIASHGHTIFHSPEIQMTVQIGEGAAIAKETNCMVVSDLRTADIAFNGQGAPIVPLVDKLLFSEFEACLNIGGIANISITKQNKTTAFDISPANQILNYLAELQGFKYDEGGRIAQSGNIYKPLLEALNKLEFYAKSTPKSMANGWIRDCVFPILNQYEIPIEDKLRTSVEHIAFQFSKAVEQFNISTPILTTGGGTFNSFLIQKMEKHSKLKIHIPNKQIVEFKEALAMAFLGLLRIKNEANVLASVTGASQNTINGAIYAASNF